MRWKYKKTHERSYHFIWQHLKDQHRAVRKSKHVVTFISVSAFLKTLEIWQTQIYLSNKNYFIQQHIYYQTNDYLQRCKYIEEFHFRTLNTYKPPMYTIKHIFIWAKCFQTICRLIIEIIEDYLSYHKIMFYKKLHVVLKSGQFHGDHISLV